MHEITVAKTAGFCPGVKRAIDLALELAQNGKSPIYTLGPLIHNTQVIETLEEKNIRAVAGLDGVAGKDGVIVIRAHGVTPELEQKIRSAGTSVVDATCPLVKHAHRVIEKYAAEGYSTVIVGDKGHAEVEGLLGYARGRGFAVSGPEQAQMLPDFDKVNVVSQTTQEEEIFLAAAEVIKKKSKLCVVSNTICQPTKDRQRETAALAAESDLVIVVGGKHSANTARLAQLCGALCKNVAHIETEDELSPELFAGRGRITITAGASTPSWVIDRVASRAREMLKQNAPSRLSAPRRLWELVISSCLYTAAAAASLTYVCTKLQGAPVSRRLLLLSGLFVLSLHIINRASEKGVGAADTRKKLIFHKHRFLTMSAGAAIGLLAVMSAALLGMRIFVPVLLFWILGVMYPFRHLFNVKLLSDAALPGSRDIVTALGWGFVCAYIPAAYGKAAFSGPHYLALAYAVTLVFARSIMLSISAVRSDLIVGRENFYKAFGEKATGRALVISAAMITALPALLAALGFNRRTAIALAAGGLYTIGCLALYRRGAAPRSIWAETIVDGQFIALGLLEYAIG